MPSPTVVLPGVVERLGDREVHCVHQEGDGPPVVLLGGCGVPYYAWDVVVSRLPSRRLVRLDRPGLGGTAWPGVLPRLADEVATLSDLIDGLGEPAVVVAHSMAGLHAEALARLHPGQVSGLVLVDGSVEWSPKRPSSGSGWLRTARLTRAAMTVPPFRPLGPLADRLLTTAQSGRKLFDPVADVAKAVYRDPDTVASVVAEQAAYDGQVWELEEIRLESPFPEVAVVVLTAAGDGGASWVDKQRRLAELLGGQQLVADDSRHLIMIDRPDLVVDSVTTVARDKESPDG